MGVRRGAVSLIVNDLLKQGLVVEGATGETLRGRKPTFLYIDSRRRAVVAVDVRASKTFVQLTDLLGKPVTGIVNFADAARSEDIHPRARRPDPPAQRRTPRCSSIEGLGVVVPGMVERSTMQILHAPTLGWRNVHLREPLAAATGLVGADRELGPRLRPGAGLGDPRRQRARATSCSSASPTASASA